MTATLTPTLQALDAELRRISATYSGKHSWALTDITTGLHIDQDEDDVMPTASLIKTPILAALYRAVDEGRVSLDSRLKYGEEHRVLGSGVLSKLSFGVEMTVRDAAVLMMIISDNSATNICIDLVGIDRINATMRDLGLPKTSLFQRLGDRAAGLDARKMSVSTAGEMCRLFELIARHECVSADASEDMLRIMRRSDYRHELSRELPWNEMNMLPPDPATAWVAEKGGSFLNGVRTSAAVFKGPSGSYVMASFCEGGTGPGTGRDSEGNVLTGRLGKAAWDALAA